MAARGRQLDISMRCDSHVHVVGPPDRFPQAPTRSYLAGVARLEDLRRLGAAHGISRFVIVQPSFYGTDNQALLESLDALGPLGRGVAVVDPERIPGDVLADFHARGVRGARLNLYSTAAGRDVRNMDRSFAAMEKVAQAANWHVEVIAPIAVLAGGADVIARARVPVVIDHYGIYGGARPDGAEGRALLELMRRPHVWMKLSAPYRVSDNPLETKPDREWLAAMLAAAPDRCVWGSDWPHTPPHELCKGADIAVPYRIIAYSTMVDDFVAAVGNAALAERVMSENATRLYEFASA
jgi:predicted TIM-barrel fold metal-dependent hydrolase